MKYKLLQKGRWIYIRPFPESALLKLIEKEFSYKKKGAEFMPNPAWAWVKLYQKVRGRLPIGLLHKLQQILTNNNYTYENLFIRSILKHLKQKDDGLYSFQKSALKMILLRSGGILQMPTGSGKTKTTISAINTINLKTLVIVPTLDLVAQWKSQVPKNVEVKTYQGLKSKKYIQQFGLVVMDECHHTPCATIQKIGLNLNEDALTIGLSATPMMRDDDNLKVESVLGPIVYKISLRELINEGYLVDAVIHFHHLNNMDNPYIDYFETYNNYILNNKERNNKIIQLAQESNGPTLILVKLIEHGEKLQEELFSHGSIFLNGSVKNREDKMDHKIIIATSIFDEGIDIPHLKTLIIAGGGKSAIKTTQRIGRVLRKFPGKKIAMVHDFADDCKWLKKHYLERREIYEKDFEVIDCD